MFLKSLHLKNIRCIQDMDLSFTTDQGKVRQWTILLGENGTGKSTVLRAIALVLVGSEALRYLASDTESWIRRGEEYAEIRAVLTTAKEEERTIALHFERGQQLRQMFDANKESLDALDQALAYTTRNYFTVGYGVSRRLPAATSLTPSLSKGRYEHPRANSVATLFDPDADLAPLEAWAAGLQYRRGDEGLELIRSALADFLPGIEFDGIDKEQQRLIFRTDDGLVPLSMLSDGFQNAISWCGDLLYRMTETFDDYRRPLRARGLMLMDEIGLHLHLKWQRRLREFMTGKFPNLQIVATTHSPFAAHQAGEGELFSLVREDAPEGRIKLLRFEGAPNQLMLHQLVMTPFFGLSTMNSRKWEEIREEYRGLEAQATKSSSDTRRMQKLEEQLADQPDWSAGQSYFGEVRSLLKDIRDEKATRG